MSAERDEMNDDRPIEVGDWVEADTPNDFGEVTFAGPNLMDETTIVVWFPSDKSIGVYTPDEVRRVPAPDNIDGIGAS